MGDTYSSIGKFGRLESFDCEFSNDSSQDGNGEDKKSESCKSRGSDIDKEDSEDNANLNEGHPSNMAISSREIYSRGICRHEICDFTVGEFQTSLSQFHLVREYTLFERTRDLR